MKELEEIEAESKRRHEETERVLNLSTKKIGSIQKGIENEIGKTRKMIEVKYDRFGYQMNYFGNQMGYLVILATGILVYALIAPLEIPGGYKTLMICMSVVIPGYFFYRHAKKNIHAL